FTPYMTLLAAFNVFLYSATGQEDLCVGSPIASRPYPETEPLIGFFINTVVMRTSLANNPSFLELIGRVKKHTLDALAHQALPFDKLVEAVRPPRDLSRMPLFQVNFRVQAGSPAPLVLDGMSAELPVFLDSGTSKFDLGLEFPITAESQGFWEYSTDLFDESTIVRMAADFSKLIADLIAQPNQPIVSLPTFRELCARWQRSSAVTPPTQIAPTVRAENLRPQLKRRTSATVPQRSPGRIPLRKAVPVARAPVELEKPLVAPNVSVLPVVASANLRPDLAPIHRRNPDEPCPLSFAQQRLWFLDQLQPNTATYNIPYYSRLSGPVNVTALQRAIEAVVARHEVLRTVFACAADTPTQILLPKWNVPLQQIDLREVPASDREAHAQTLLRAESARPFNLQSDVMLRTALLRLADNEYYFLHTSHHIAWEYWSTALWFAELSRHYAAFCDDRPPVLPELPVQYGDYARWQRQWLQGEAYDRLVAYWKKQLAGAPPKLELPIDHARPPIQSLRGARVPMDLPADLLDAAKSVSRDCGATPFMTMLAAFQTFLYCLTGQTDICVGSPVASRPKAETKGLIGFFANTLVLRSQLADDPTYRQLVERVRVATLGAIANQGLPFDKLVEVLRPPRDLSRMPLFQVNFRAQRAPLEALQLEGLTITPPVFIDNGTSKFDLALEVVATPGGEGCNSGGFWEYSFDLFEPDTIRRMSREFEQVLCGVVTEPDTRLNSLEIVRTLRGRYQNVRLG
ncbi:MAG: hypothetical protein HY043_20800, partial [Verrucomicrobia bacterium]|nr:hypothetical protein [Verrucomicrobiota bacterium]